MNHVTMYDVRAVVPWALPPSKGSFDRRHRRGADFVYATLSRRRACDGTQAKHVDPFTEPTCPTCRLLWAARAIRQDAAMEAA